MNGGVSAIILQTKLFIPQMRTSLVSRPALLDKLQNGMRIKLTLVGAFAGYGKTTLLSEWAQQCGAPVAWVSLDSQDNDFPVFWRYVLAAVDRRFPDFSRQVLPMLNSMRGAAYLPFLTALINELAAVPGELAIVLDDYHLIEHPAVHQALTSLLEYLPPNVHLFVASRFQLPIPMAKLQAKGQMQRIEVQDLRFRLDEGIIFYRECLGLKLEAEDVSQLVERTEGWISGLHLAALSAGQSEHAASFIRDFGGSHRDIANYLLEEVLRQQPEDMRYFLLQTSILERMNSSLCSAVTGWNEAACQDKLELLERLNLLIVPLDEYRNQYRYHHLFSEFLKRQLQRTNPEEEVLLHAKAAVWWESRGQASEAIGHYMAGGHMDKAVRLIERVLPDLLQLKKVVLAGWLAALPEAYFAEKPMLDIFWVSVLIIMGNMDGAEARLRSLKARLSEAGDEPWRGYVYQYLGNLAYVRKNIGQIAEYWEQFDHYMPEGNDLQMLGGNLIQGSENDNILAYYHDLHIAEPFLSHWIHRWQSKSHYPFVGYLMVSYSELMYEWNRLDEAEHYAEQALNRTDTRPFARILTHAAIRLSWVQWARGHKERAWETTERVKGKIRSPDLPAFIHKLEAHQACLKLMSGYSGEGIDSWIANCGLKPFDEIPLYRLTEYLCLARALAQTGHLDQAAQMLERMDRLTKEAGRLRDRIRVLILYSMILDRMEDETGALNKLEQALKLGGPQDYARSFLDEGARMVKLMSRYRELNSNKRSDGERPEPDDLALARRLLLRSGLKAGGLKASLPAVDSLTNREAEILSALASGLSNKEIASRFGLTEGTVKNHVFNLYGKLGAKRRAQAIALARDLKLLK